MMAIFSGTQKLLDILRYFFTWFKSIQKENSFFDRTGYSYNSYRNKLFHTLISPKGSTHVKNKWELYIYISACIYVNFTLIYLIDE